MSLLIAALAWLAFMAPAALAQTPPSPTTQAATGVTAVQATLNGTSTGDSGYYCSFVVGELSTGDIPYLLNQYPAQPCGSSYSVTVNDFFFGPGESLNYAAVVCAATTTSGGATFCARNSATGAYWSAIDPCYTNHYPYSLVGCPEFTTQSIGTTTSAATQITGAGAVLNGSLQLNGDTCNDVEYQFVYSTDSQLSASSSTTAQGLYNATPPFAQCPSSSSTPSAPIAVSAAVGNLPSGTTIYYRLDAITEGVSGNQPPVTFAGPIESFRTGGYVTDQAATSITASSAQINADVAAGNDGYTYSWLYSASDATSSAGALDSNASSVSGGTVGADVNQNVSFALSGLTASTTYYYQVVAHDTTTGSYVYGLPTAFTTLPFGCSSGQTAYTNQSLGSTGFDVNGCVSGSGPWTVYGTAVINGLTFDGGSGATVTIDPTSSQLSISTGYTIDLGTATLYNTSSAALSNVSFTTSGGTSTFDLPQVTSGAKLFSLTIGGTTSVAAAASGGATVTINALGMPIVFSGITAQATVSVNQDGSLSSVTAQLGNSTIGALTLPGAQLSYSASTNEWTGTVNLQIPYINSSGLQGAGFSATLVIENGQLNGIGGSLTIPNGVPLGETVFITSISFNTIFNPVTIEGSLGGSVGPTEDGVQLFGFNTGFYMGFNQDQTLTGLPGIANNTVVYVPFTLGLNGQLSLFGILNLASANLEVYDLPKAPLVAFTAQIGQPIDWSCGSFGGSIGVDSGINIAGDATAGGFNLLGKGYITFQLCNVFNGGLTVHTLISSTGGAFCASVLNNSVGLGFYWPTSLSSLSDIGKNLQLYLTGGCNVGNYVANLTLAASGGARGRVLLPPGLPFAVMRVRGVGGAPYVNVFGPGGLRIHTNGIKGALARGHLVIPDPARDTTYVEIARPRAGVYRVVPERGSVPIKVLAVAHGERPPRVLGRLRRERHGRMHVFFSARPLPHQTLVVQEIGAGGSRQLLRTSRSRGSFTYLPRPGLAGERVVQVLTYEYGRLSHVFQIGRFRGQMIPAPARPTHLTLRRRGIRAFVRWRPVRGATRGYRVVVIALGSHRMFFTRRALLVVGRGIPGRGPVAVVVTAVNALGRGSRPARAFLR
ncbi:hypothetical protein [Conexibacter sp. S30A1]|uniref:hypothetical protein n=1 Tax=Conexibacter sp. S30A1 TaxID=2937800 RepID=UPI00200C3F61|nr:hypothetical protein [Conexibacter sp. S30A1]